MNLTSLFNFNFIKENIKKSKAVILLCTLLIPIINVVIYLFHISDSYVKYIYDVAPLSLFGLYIIPIILSITLFSFVYKRNTSDFVMGLPISKKQVFASNTLAGIIILTLSNLINYLLILFVSIVSSNFIVDYRMLFDVFILWTVSYIFVFVCTNIAASVSSNKITTVAVTMLILFLVPFFHSVVLSHSNDYSDVLISCSDSRCKPINYECYNNECNVNLTKNIYMHSNIDKINTTNYTIPYALIGSFAIDTDSGINIDKSLIKMGILSVIYIGVGLLLFNKRKFEVVDTSFKSDWVHLIVRSLTTVPIAFVYYLVFEDGTDILTIVLLFILIMTYLIIYDLLTRKKVTNVFKAFMGFIVVCAIVTISMQLSTGKDEVLDVNDIDKITFDCEKLHANLGYTYDKKIINYVMANVIDSEVDVNYNNYFDVIINSKNGVYEARFSLNDDKRKELVNMLYNDKTYMNSVIKVNNDTAFGSKINDIIKLDMNSDLTNKLIDEFNKNVFYDGSDDLFNVAFLTYNDYEVNENLFNVGYDKKLCEEILNYYNLDTKQLFDNFGIGIGSYYYSGDNIYYSGYEFDTYELDKFIINNVDEKVDINKEYVYVTIYNGDYGNHIFVTNKVDELESILDKISNNIYGYEDGDIDEDFTH